MCFNRGAVDCVTEIDRKAEFTAARNLTSPQTINFSASASTSHVERTAPPISSRPSPQLLTDTFVAAKSAIRAGVVHSFEVTIAYFMLSLLQYSRGMAALPPARRVVTGHDAIGKAFIESDMSLSPIPPSIRITASDHLEGGKLSQTKNNGGFINMFRTDGFPAKNNFPWTDYHGVQMSLADSQGTTVRVVDMLPQKSSLMHRTVSLDIGTVISGEVVLEMDDGVETLLKTGDTVIQRGTIHAWHNRTDTMARMLFVLVPAQPVVIDGKILEPTKFPVKS